MATSSFKSTTRRSPSGANQCNVVPSPSRSDGYIQNGSHRKPRRKLNTSQAYLSDDSSTSENRCSDQRSRWRERCPGRHHTQVDSESDMDGSFGLRRGRDLNFASQAGTNDLFYRHCGLRRSSMPDRAMERKTKIGASLDCLEPIRQHSDSLELERNIKALHSKPMQRGPAKDGVTRCDAKLAEIRRAVEMVRTEVQQSVGSHDVKTQASESANCPIAKDITNTHALADIQKEYTEKLLESQNRVRLLWSQLVVEERRCLEFAKIIQELLPDSKSTHQIEFQTERATTDKQRLPKFLHEAQKYIESISILDSDTPGDPRVTAQAIKDVNEGCTKELSYRNLTSAATPSGDVVKTGWQLGQHCYCFGQKEKQPGLMQSQHSIVRTAKASLKSETKIFGQQVLVEKI